MKVYLLWIHTFLYNWCSVSYWTNYVHCIPSTEWVWWVKIPYFRPCVWFGSKLYKYFFNYEHMLYLARIPLNPNLVDQRKEWSWACRYDTYYQTLLPFLKFQSNASQKSCWRSNFAHVSSIRKSNFNWNLIETLRTVWTFLF